MATCMCGCCCMLEAAYRFLVPACVPVAAYSKSADNTALHALTHADPHDRAGLRAAGRSGHPRYLLAQPDRLSAIPAHRPGGAAARAGRLQQPGLVVSPRGECTDMLLLPAACQQHVCFVPRPARYLSIALPNNSNSLPTFHFAHLPTDGRPARSLVRPSLVPNPHDALPNACPSQPSKCTLPCPQMAARLEALPRHELAAAVTEALTGPPHYPPKPPLGSLLSGIMAPARTTRFVEPPQARRCVLGTAWFGCCLPAHWYGRLLAAEGCWPHLRTWAASHHK